VQTAGAVFLFLFLPVVLAGSFLLAKFGPRVCAAWLPLASVFFYGWWDVRYVPLLLGSVVFNHKSAILP
jgi:alginate O-acetyltransferase complex protein AlgI